MPSLADYDAYLGRHPVTGSIGNALAYQRTRAPHRGSPFSEALLAGIAGGVMVGYFYFDYQGEHPQVNIVTRNSFHRYGFDAVAARLGLRRELYQTTSESRARENLQEILESGDVPIVTADVYSLGYERSEFVGDMWSMQPLVVSAYETDGDATIADRSRSPLIVPASRLDAARGHIKKERFRIETIEYDPGDEARLASAVETGIRECLDLYDTTPPAGSATNFGFRALERWIAALRKPTGKTSWHTLFPGGRRLFAALSSAYRYSSLFWKDQSEQADRGLYADFLEEAAEILSEPGLRSVAQTYREAAAAWRALAVALLPEEEPLLATERRLQHEAHTLFLQDGTAGAARRSEIVAERAELLRRAEELPADEPTRARLFAPIAEALERVLELERAAAEALGAVVGRGD